MYVMVHTYKSETRYFTPIYILYITAITVRLLQPHEYLYLRGRRSFTEAAILFGYSCGKLPQKYSENKVLVQYLAKCGGLYRPLKSVAL